jgi:acid phosphatase
MVYRLIRFASAVALMGGMCSAQVGPPTCPGQGAQPSVAAAASSRQHAASALAVEAAGAADPKNLVSPVPMENFGITRYRLADYADCVGNGGCYWADVDAQARRAEAALDGLAASRKAGEKLALVLDIDETALSGYCEMKREDFGYIDAMFNAWVVTSEADVSLPGTLRLFRRARAAGVSVFFITGRPESQRMATERNLHAAGYEGWEHLALRDSTEINLPTMEYKSAERKKIVEAGYRIAMNVGDQWSDLNGAPRAEVSVKLPNPFYFLP